MYHQQQQVFFNGGYPLQQQQQQQQQFVQQMSVKVKFNNTIRRFSVPSTCSLNEFYQQVSKSFQFEINSNTHLVQYKDNEDDLIVTTSEEEWIYAKNSFSTPCMQVTLKERVVQKKEASKKETPVSQPTEKTTTPSSPQKQPPSSQSSPKLIPTQTQPMPTQVQPVQTQPLPSHPATTVMEDSLGFVTLNTSQLPSPYVARFSYDVNLPDGSAVYVNQPVTKTWKIVNPGSTSWPANVKLHCRDSKTLPFEIISSNVPTASPNQSVEVSLTFIPRKVGPLKGYFNLCSGDIQFGHTFWLELIVHPLPVAEAPQQNEPSINQTIQQVRDLKIDDIKEFDSDDEDSDDEEETTKFEDERFNALKEKYQFQLDVLSNMGMTNQRALVNILEQNGGDVSETIQQFILLSSKME